ncbi:RNA polymerase sigma-70 factor [Dyadobacter psychrotolerans]|uniref:RNA polymerase sigma-70 factor n=1 Tax=Dyadobacter psychrotolerans TaxID=2541721 RepID=A0A4R5DMR5_9BACT|nr:RNA polymerase sigma-70 factor [Dyadobacter psychrotolerans]TDE15582.1 RNA polymerase sigma-70 factor [Dyadobacter psychrotolerans]
MTFLLPSDQILIDRLQKGDEKAFKEIYNRYWKKLYVIALRKLSDTDIAEGIVQDIFLSIWERRTSLQIENLEAYLVTSVRFGCINQIKASVLHEKYELYTYAYDSEEISVTEEQLDLNDLINTIENQLRSFPESWQQIFRLHRLEYRSTKEISKQLNIPQRTVELHLSRVVQALRISLHDYL